MYGMHFIVGMGFLAFVTAIAYLLSRYLAFVFDEKSVVAGMTLSIQRFLRCSNSEQHWLEYAQSLLVFNALGIAALLFILTFQSILPWNPQAFDDVSLIVAWHTAVSFVTNTNLQAYVPENTLSYFSQSFGLVTQHFLSASSGMCVALVLMRAFIKESSQGVGNFYNDMLRCVIFLFLPLATLLAFFLLAQGVPQNWNPYVSIEGNLLAMGPVASQTAIKILGGNGGGFFSTNAAHPFENPTLLSNYVQIACILILPIASIFLFGRILRRMREAWVLFTAVTIIFVMNFTAVLYTEMQVPPWFPSNVTESYVYEGKEYRNGILGSALWSAVTTATSNGSNNVAIASQNPFTIAVMLLQMHLGEMVYGGIGSGFYTLIVFAIISVFMAGLMIGRSAEYLGKKIEHFEIKACILAFLCVPVVIFGGLTVALSYSGISKLTLNPGAMGFSEILYVYSSAAANNGSSLAGFNMVDPVIVFTLSAVMLLGRFLPMICVLALAGRLAGKKRLQATIATLATDNATFVILLLLMILLLGALTYFPVLTLGPLADYFSLRANI